MEHLSTSTAITFNQLTLNLGTAPSWRTCPLQVLYALCEKGWLSEEGMGLCGGGVRMKGAVGEWGEDGAGGCQI